MKKIFKGFKSPEDRDAYYTEEARLNVKNGSVILIAVIIFEIAMLLRIFVYESPPYTGRTLGYLICYITLLVFSVLNLSAAMYIKLSRKDNVPLASLIAVAYSIGITIWSIAITVLDSQKNEQFIVYLTVVVTAVNMLRLRPWLFMTLQIGGFAALTAALLIFVEDFNVSQLINLAVFSIVFLIFSISHHNHSISEFYSKRKIEQLNALLESENEEIERAAKTDQLTGMYNRYLLKETVSEQIKRSFTNKTSVGFAMFDLDDFKCVNDTYGHAVGDECLIRLSKCFSEYKQLTVYRYGGEEFLAVCDSISEKEFSDIILEIIKKVSLFDLSVEGLHITVSAGYTYTVPFTESCDEELIKLADKALYTAKTEGKNRAVKI